MRVLCLLIAGILGAVAGFFCTIWFIDVFFPISGYFFLRFEDVLILLLLVPAGTICGTVGAIWLLNTHFRAKDWARKSRHTECDTNSKAPCPGKSTDTRITRRAEGISARDEGLTERQT